MKIFVKEQLSPHKYKTPEGYLICTDAILARTGKQMYKKCDFFPDAADGDADYEVDRLEEDVFDDAAVASFENKPITVEHPDENVNSTNWKKYEVGYVRDAHRGQIDDRPVLLANLVIRDEQTIREIEAGEHTDLSCGYDCDIADADTAPHQVNIRGNHVALCREGRAGIARIQDSKSTHDEKGSLYGNTTKIEEIGETRFIEYDNDDKKYYIASGDSRYSQAFNSAEEAKNFWLNNKELIRNNVARDSHADDTIIRNPQTISWCKDVLHDYIAKAGSSRKPEITEVQEYNGKYTIYTSDFGYTTIDRLGHLIDTSSLMLKRFMHDSIKDGHSVRTVEQLGNGVYVEYDEDEKKYYIASDYDRYQHSFNSIGQATSYYKLYKRDIDSEIKDSVKDVDTSKLSLEEAKRLYNEGKISKGELDDISIREFEKQHTHDVEPNEGEDKQSFISRFMRATKEEYPDRKQRLAVAYSYWDKAKDSCTKDAYMNLTKAYKDDAIKAGFRIEEYFDGGLRVWGSREKLQQFKNSYDADSYAHYAEIRDSLTKDTAMTITTMCFIIDNDKILIQNRVGPNWPGLAVPGGHVKADEDVADSCIREVNEETGLTVNVSDLTLVGTYQYHCEEDGACLAMCYQTSTFSGELHSSEEGEVFWMKISDMLKADKCADGFKELFIKLFPGYHEVFNPQDALKVSKIVKIAKLSKK